MSAIDVLKNRMMTLATTITGAVAYAEAQGIEVLDWLGGFVAAGQEAGAGIYAAIVAGMAILQNYLNRDKA